MPGLDSNVRSSADITAYFTYGGSFPTSMSCRFSSPTRAMMVLPSE
jgi:hypothetical protein